MARRIVCVLTSILATVAFTAPVGAQVDFGTVDLGQIETQCIRLCFASQGSSSCDGTGTVSQLEIDAPFSVHGIRRGPSGEDLCGKPQKSQAVKLPANLAAGESLVFDIDLVADSLGFFEEDLFANGDPLVPFRADVGQAPPCQPTAPDNLCLQDDRFTVRVNWRTQAGTRGPGPVVPGVGSDDSGLLYFFNPDNWEMLVKVLDACNTKFDSFWVFYAATTNVEFTLTVTDTEAQQVRTYFNPLQHPAPPVQDTSAFATCP